VLGNPVDAGFGARASSPNSACRSGLAIWS
jgi:hypothetical protein